MKILETSRLIFRRLEPGDLDSLWALYTDPEVRRYIPDAPRSDEEAREELEWHQHGHPKHPELGLWATIHKETGQFIGRCGLLPWTIDGREEVEVAYLLARAYWGQGLGTEAAQGIAGYAFEQLHITRLVCMIEPGNLASEKVARKIGMTLEKEMEDEMGPYLLYSSDRGPGAPNTFEPPTAFPEPGVYDSAQMITLLSKTPGAEIYYTLDGSPPTPASPRFDPYRLIPMLEFGQEMPAGGLTMQIRAIARLGERTSAERAFNYKVEPRGRDEYLTQALAPGLWMIRDFENDKMYLLTGSRRALLIDAGMGRGDLRAVVEPLIGSLPLEVAITHGHPDHIAQMGRFQQDCDVYLHPADLPLVIAFAERLHYDIDLVKIKPLEEGHVFDLGDRRLRAYHVPGHSKGSIVLLDEENGLLFAGDAIGSNRPTIVDALWLQRSEDPIEVYLATLKAFRAKAAGKIRLTYGGHNDAPLVGEAYLDHLQEAAQRLVDRGRSVLTPSPRPSGAWQVVSGDRLTDPNWAAINVNWEKCLPAGKD